MAERCAREIAKHRLVVRLLHGDGMLRALPFGILTLVTLGAASRADELSGCGGGVRATTAGLRPHVPQRNKSADAQE